MADPVTFDVERAPTFRRAQVALRLLLLILISWVSHPFGLLWLVLPVAVAIRISQKGGQRYLDEDGTKVTNILRWIVAVLAYLALLIDELPEAGESPVRFEVERTGSPTVGSALLRIIYAIPSVIVLAILGIAGAFVWLVSAVFVVVGERYPESFWRFLRGLVRWEARLLAYLASLTDRYPPFRLETGPAASRLVA